MNNELIEKIHRKYKGLGEDPETYLKGFLQAKPINYWDYIETETLLTLQKPRTDFKDEAIFIMYHQVTELVLKMMLHEIKQLVLEQLSEKTWIEKLNRITRYTEMLITSFGVMRSGMSYEDYNTFRLTLAPASGFQSVQFRQVELYCTRIENLLNSEAKKEKSSLPSLDFCFENLYWKEAGLNRKTGKKTLTLRQFEERYENGLKDLCKDIKGNTIEEKVNSMNCSNKLIESLKRFDVFYNVKWPMVHLKTAEYYLDSKGENKAATGGSEWKKYLHPKFQQRRFFPSLWSKVEIENWGH